jgi:ATP synthase protein I
VAAVELPGLKRVAYGVVVAQVAITVVLALVCLVQWGREAALSAAIGGGIGAASNLTLALLVFGRPRRELAEMVRAFYIGEAAKIGVTIALFVLVLATLKGMLVPGALFGGFATTFLVHWFVLPRAMRKLDSGQLG